MTAEEHAKMAQEHMTALAELRASVKSAHKRLDDTQALTAGIHELTKGIAEIATELKLLTKRLDSTIERIEQGQKEQGIRIGSIEKCVLNIERGEKQIAEHEKRLDEIDKAPGDKWNRFTWLVFAAVAGALVAFLAGRLL
jgi:chromosome segregation ATPase